MQRVGVLLRVLLLIVGSVLVVIGAVALLRPGIERLAGLSLAGRIEIATGMVAGEQMPVGEGAWIVENGSGRRVAVVRVATGGYRSRLVVLVGIDRTGR